MATSGRARRYHHGDLRRTLLQAAMGLLEAEGADRVGLRELARLVGVSPAAPYRHFDNRIALLEALAITGFQRFDQSVTAAGQAAPEPQRLAAMGQAYVRFALDNPNLFRLMFSSELKRAARPMLAIAADAAFAGLRAVTAREANGRIAALKAWAQVHGLAVLLLDGQIAVPAGEDIDALIAGVVGPGA